MVDRAPDQPSLEEIAAHVHLSPYHFQRLFCRWAGTTPKRFLQVLTLERGKGLLDNSRSLLDGLHNAWPLSSIRENLASTRHAIDAFFSSGTASRHGPLSLHVTGTNFQIAVWRALLKISPGAVASYAQVAKALGVPRSARAVGNAVGANPVALLIPCHRVIQQSGALGGYRWGATKKLMVQTWERMRDEPVAL